MDIQSIDQYQSSDYIFKIIAVGDAGVGKTSLTLRFATNKFRDDYRMTLGMNLSTKNVTIGENSIQMAVWDTGGQASFEPLLPMYYRGALGALVVYDITNRKSFESISKWMNDIKKFAEEIPVVLIGNKKDLIDNAQVTTEEGDYLADMLRTNWSKPIHYKETSAKADLAVIESFTLLTESILKIAIAEEEDDFEFDFPTF